MEEKLKITCEVCGEGDVVNTNESRQMHIVLDLWMCDHCCYVFSFVMTHVREASRKAKDQGQMDDVERAVSQMEKRSKLYHFKHPLPSVITKNPFIDRMDSLMIDDHD